MNTPRKNILTRTIDDCNVSFNLGRDGKGYIRQASKSRHFADHKTFFLFGDDGKLLGQREIDETSARLILDQFEQRGSTEAFYLTEKEVQTGVLDRSRPMLRAVPESVRHVETTAERSFTAMGEKLDFHWPIFEKLRETGYGSIIRATMTLHQVCSSHCQFCSTIMRNRSDSISLEEAKDFVLDLHERQIAFNREHFPDHNKRYKEISGHDIGLRGLILSGGGQPNLWPHFEEFVGWLSGFDIDLGLITNGFPRRISEEIYNHFTWIRLSVTPADASPFYPQGRFEGQYIPDNLIGQQHTTMGLSYVYGPWTDETMLRRLDDAAQAWGFEYCRLLTDCNLTRSAQLKAHQELSDALFGLGLIDTDGNPKSKIFHQLKYHGDSAERNETWPDGQCMLQSYNVFWDTTGHDETGDSYCYPCDSVTVLADEQVNGDVEASARRFNPEKWGTVQSKRVRDLYEQPLKPWFDPRAICQSCLFVRNNIRVRELTQMLSYEQLGTKKLKHVNFP